MVLEICALLHYQATLLIKVSLPIGIKGMLTPRKLRLSLYKTIFGKILQFLLKFYQKVMLTYMYFFLNDAFFAAFQDD